MSSSYESAFKYQTIVWLKEQLRYMAPEVQESLIRDISNYLPDTGKEQGFNVLLRRLKKFLESDELARDPHLDERFTIDRGYARLSLILSVPQLKKSLPPF